MGWQEIDGVLMRFGKSKARSVRGYRQFIADGIDTGRRDDLVGGGLKRSLFGQEESKEFTAYDERILGSGGFVEALTGGDNTRSLKRLPLSLADLLQNVCEITKVDAETIRRYGKERSVSKTRAIFCFLAVHEYGYTGKEAGTATGLGSSGVSIAVRRGEELVKKDPSILARIVGTSITAR